MKFMEKQLKLTNKQEATFNAVYKALEGCTTREIFSIASALFTSTTKAILDSEEMDEDTKEAVKNDIAYVFLDRVYEMIEDM